MKSANRRPTPARLNRLKNTEKSPEYAEQFISACERANLAVERAFGKKAATLKRARRGLFISYRNHVALLKIINATLKPPAEIEYPWAVDGPSERENFDEEKVFQGLTRMTIYDHSAEHAKEMFKRCRKAGQFLAAAHWADHAAGEYRKQGNLKIASKCLEDCFRAMDKIPKQEKNSIEMGLLSLRVLFEQIMVREYMMLGEFSEALKSFQNLDAEADLLTKLNVPEKLKGEIGSRKTHNKRQQAEMLRLLGHYSAALSQFEEIQVEYAITSYAAQGKNADHVIFSDSAIRAATNQKQWYVTISRGRKGVHIFTTDKQQLRENIASSGNRQLAIELEPERISSRETVARRLRI